MKLEKLVIGSFASIVEAGTIVEANTVSASYYPDPATKSSEWHSLGCVLDAAPEVEEEDDPDYCPSVFGGYDKIPDPYVVRDSLKLSLRMHSEVIHRLVWGVAAKMANSTSQTPFAKKQRHVECWMHFQARAQDGTDRFIAALYGRLRIDGAPTWSKDPTKPAVRFDILRSTIASVTPASIVS